MISLAGLMTQNRMPDHAVAWQGDSCVTWGVFRARVAALSSNLAAREEQSWLLARDAPLDFAVALFGLWHAGKQVVLPPSLREGAVAEAAGQVDGIIDEAVALSWPDATSSNDSPPLERLDPRRTRLDLFTSGSTGKPKRVTKTLAQLDAEVAVLEGLWGDIPGPVLATVPHHHIYGLLFRLLWPLSAGRAFDTETCTVPEILLARLQRLGLGVLVSSPSQLTRMPDLVPLAELRGRVRRIFSSGGPLPAATATQFQAALGQAPTEVLGSTETGGIAWRCQDGAHGDGWTPLPGVEICIAADHALSLRSPFLPDGRPLTTGDAAEALADGRFRLLGRVDRIVKIEEKRLALADMEERLRRHPWVADAGVVVLSGRRQSLGAALALNEAGRAYVKEAGRYALARQIRQYLAPWFDAVLLPRHWRYPKQLPYNERGKLAAADLAELFERAESGHA